MNNRSYILALLLLFPVGAQAFGWTWLAGLVGGCGATPVLQNTLYTQAPDKNILLYGSIFTLFSSYAGQALGAPANQAKGIFRRWISHPTMAFAAGIPLYYALKNSLFADPNIASEPKLARLVKHYQSDFANARINLAREATGLMKLVQTEPQAPSTPQPPVAK